MRFALALPLAVGLACLIGTPAASQTIAATTGTISNIVWSSGPNKAMVAADWTSNATGDCVFTISNLRGHLDRLTFDPTIAAASPTNAYDVSITDRDGIVLYNNDSLSNTTKLSVCPALSTYFQYHVEGSLTVTFSNAGASKTARNRIYWTRVD